MSQPPFSQNPYGAQYPQSSYAPGQFPANSYGAPQYGQQPGQYPQQQQFPQQYGQNVPFKQSSTPQQQYGQPQANQYGAPPPQVPGTFSQSQQYPYSAQPQSPYSSQPPQTQFPSQTPQQSWAHSYGNNVSPMEMQTMQAWFTSMDRNRTGQITATELANLALQFGPIGFPTAKVLVKVFDKDYSGTIDFNEFVSLNQFVLRMQASFFQADLNRTGTLDAKEIFNALSSAGFQMSLPTVQAICLKYDKSGSGQVGFESFIQICAHLAAVRSIFEWNDPQRVGKVTLTYDQLSHITIHLMDK